MFCETVPGKESEKERTESRKMCAAHLDVHFGFAAAAVAAVPVFVHCYTVFIRRALPRLVKVIASWTLQTSDSTSSSS